MAKTKKAGATQKRTSHQNIMNLLFDANNYRLPEEYHGISQPSLFQILIEEYDVETIAHSISEQGFYQHESLIVVEEDKKLIVLEGNRRLAACRALLLPDEVNEAFRKKFKAIAANTNLEELRELPVVLYSSRSEAKKLIESLHTKPGRKQWDPLSKARWDREMNSNDKKLFYDANKVLDTYQVAKALDLPKEVKEVVNNEREFNATNLMRIFNDANCKTYLQYDYDKNGNLAINLDANEFAKGASLIVADVVNAPSFSRLTDKPRDRKEYINKKRLEYTPDYSKKDNFTVETFAKKRTKAKTIETNTIRQVKAKPKTYKPKQNNVVPTDFVCGVEHKRINMVLNELRNIPIYYPNASAILIRVLLEISLFTFLEDKGQIQLIRNKKAHDLAKKTNPQKLSSDWSPTLLEMLTWTHSNGLINKAQVNKTILRLIDNTKASPILHDLNLFVHNPEMTVLESDCKSIWRDIEPLMKEILKGNETTDKRAKL